MGRREIGPPIAIATDSLLTLCLIIDGWRRIMSVHCRWCKHLKLFAVSLCWFSLQALKRLSDFPLSRNKTNSLEANDALGVEREKKMCRTKKPKHKHRIIFNFRFSQQLKWLAVVWKAPKTRAAKRWEYENRKKDEKRRKKNNFHRVDSLSVMFMNPSSE